MPSFILQLQFYVWIFTCARHGTNLIGVSSFADVTAKRSEPQAVVSNGMGEGSGVANSLSVRTET